MGRKKSKNNQSSNVPVVGNANGDSSDSNEQNEKNAPSVNCLHIAKSVDFNQVVKGLKNGEDLKKNFCPVCVKESKGLKGSDLFVCLKCGTKACCKEHSKAHFDIPRSDLHSLAFDFTSKTLWCYSCSSEINEKEAKNKKLSTCITSLNRQLSTFTKEKSVSGKFINKNDAINEIEDDSSLQNGKKGKRSQQKNKPGINNQSYLSSLPVRGLSNLGNTCYFNSVMQCLARTQPLLKELKEMDHRVDVRIELNGGESLEGCLENWDPMTECLYETLNALLTPGPVYVPSKFLGFVRKRHEQFEGFDQHDSHELLRHTLDSIKMNDLKRYRRLMLAKKGLSAKVDRKQVPPEVTKQLKELEHKVTQVQSFIPQKTFKGKLVSTVKCQECNHSSEHIEEFLDLSLPVLADKPHPPVAKRKTGHVAEPLLEQKSRWEKRMMRRTSKLNGENKKACEEQGDCNLVVDEVAVEAQEALDFRPEGTLDLDDEKPHESGYSSEKASSSLRGSPSSEEVRSSSPCDDSWSTVPQITDSWLSSLPGGIQLPAQSFGDITPHLVNRPPTHIPLHSNGTPDLAHLSLHDSVGSTLNPLCQDTSTIMEQEPDWRERIHQRYFNPSLETENSEYLARLNEDDPQDVTSVPVPVSSLDGETGDGLVDVPIISKNNVSQENDTLVVGNDSEITLPLASTNDKVESRNVNRSLSPPFRRQVLMRPLVKRDSDFSPVREEERDSQVEQAQLETIQERISVKLGDNKQPLDACSPKEKDEEWNRTKLEEVQSMSELSLEDPPLERNSVNLEDSKQTLGVCSPKEAIEEWYRTKQEEVQAMCEIEDPSLTIFFSDVASSLDQISTPSRFGNSTFILAENSECDESSALCRSFGSPENGNAGVHSNDFQEYIQTAPHNSLDSEENGSGNDKSMNTCSEEFPDEVLPEDSSRCSGKDLLETKPNQVEDETYEDLCKKDNEYVSESLLELTDEGHFEPLLDVLPAISKLSIASSEVSKKEPELHELFEKLQTDDDCNNREKLDAVEDINTTKCNNDMKNEIASLIKRDSCRDMSECSVESCLRQFTSIEFMTGSNKVGCSACTERQNKGAKDGKTILTMATKQLLIGQAPPILILHLKRFQVQLNSFRKLTKHVSFPLILDLAPFCTSIGEDKSKVIIEEPMPYCLYGIVEHRGTLNSGHYVAYVKTGEGNERRWFCISDSHVNEVTEDRVLKTEAYLLFYSRIPFPNSS